MQLFLCVVQVVFFPVVVVIVAVVVGAFPVFLVSLSVLGCVIESSRKPGAAPLMSTCWYRTVCVCVCKAGA